MPPLKVSQEQYPDTIYDLAKVWPEQVPDQPLTYHPRHSDLARIDARYHAVQETEGYGYRNDLTFAVSFGDLEPEWYPGTRTEWVTPGVDWRETHQQRFWTDASHINSYDKGSTTSLDWFAPAVRPAFGRTDGSAQNNRAGDIVFFEVQPWSPSGTVLEHGGYYPYRAVPTQLKLYQGDTLLFENTRGASLGFRKVPSGTLPYQLVLDASRPADEWRLSTRTHTEWDFISSTNEAPLREPIPIPLLQLDYELETDLRGDVKAGTQQEISITAGPRPGTAGAGTVTSVKLEVSYDDGTTWKPVTLIQGDGDRHTGKLKLPKQPDGFISVRAAAETDAGFAIRQELIRAYGLR